MKSPLLSAVVCLFICLTAKPQSAQPADANAQKTAALIEGARRMGNSPVVAYHKPGSLALSISSAAIGRPFLWYAELLAAPVGVVTTGHEATTLIVQLERNGNRLFLRDLTAPSKEQAAAPRQPGSLSDHYRQPLDFALSQINAAPIIAVFPIVSESAEGNLFIDVTRTFSGDIPAVSARSFVALSGITPAATDPERSYIERVRLTGSALNIRSHLTFIGTPAKAPIMGPRAASVVMGHSIVFLPEKPMAQRLFDPRVGFFYSTVTEFENAAGVMRTEKKIINRFRLEKANPNAAVSDPVKPIIFHLGPGIPGRWRPYIKAGVEMWRPVFEAAGFSNAIRAVDAPAPEQDPDWSLEDVTLNIIRWLPQNMENAVGPRVSDPRSGETLSAHILLWPGVLDMFGKYYFAVFGGVDPEASTLPLPEKKLGELLSYIVAHEVGHSLGLRHNHIASTAYSVAQLRDPRFANTKGPNSSIMAYGRFNQAAQPGDGVTRFHSLIGPYDYAAIKWGYGEFEGDAAAFTRDRNLYWAAGELPDEMPLFGLDPRVLKENTGAERIEATRLGVANILRSLNRLDTATGGNPELFTQTLSQMVGIHNGFLVSVSTLLGGLTPSYLPNGTTSLQFVTADEQRKAVAYLMGEGARSLDAYRQPAILDRTFLLGGNLQIDDMQAALVSKVLSGGTLGLLELQASRDPRAYSPPMLGQDLADAVWGDLSNLRPWRMALQRGYLAATKAVLFSWQKPADTERNESLKLVAQGLPPAFARLASETGDDSSYPAWLREYLPALKSKLETAAAAAAAQNDRLHLADMAHQVDKLIQSAQ